jgi:transcriptional regulator with XRE-family HTH domain
MSMSEAAKRAGVSKTQYANLEHGYRSVGNGIQLPATYTAESIAAVAKAVGLDVDEALSLVKLKAKPGGGARPGGPTVSQRELMDLWVLLDAETRDAFLMLLRRVTESDRAKVNGLKAAGADVPTFPPAGEGVVFEVNPKPVDS